MSEKLLIVIVPPSFGVCAVFSAGSVLAVSDGVGSPLGGFVDEGEPLHAETSVPKSTTSSMNENHFFFTT
ncbi:hypothetical protein [Paenibacillus thiaminolyticus]|uniref:hypothetical protein n=1 Tax=Paenibacillus thiaminolyticus TaxID=49283 RepID=UPI0021760A33|nr:hypothetical protein [Paenibacillus thiaminolyticus]